MKIESLKTCRVEFMPKQLEPGILYVSEAYGTAAHLCACGCGAKIRTPLGPTEWAVRDSEAGPTLWPSVGNWQQQCRSHYVVENGKVIWCGQWTPAQVLAGRHREEARRVAYYAGKQKGWMLRFWAWLTSLFK
jgi:hypothetical protein